MPFTPAEEHRVGRLESDVEAIYDVLGSIQDTQRGHTRQLTSIERRLGGHDARFDAHDKRFDAIDRRFNAIDRRFEDVDRRFEDVDGQLRTLNEGMAEVLRRLDN